MSNHTNTVSRPKSNTGSQPQSTRKKKSFLWLRHIKVLLLKDLLLFKRNLFSNLLVFLLPVILCNLSYWLLIFSYNATKDGGLPVYTLNASDSVYFQLETLKKKANGIIYSNGNITLTPGTDTIPNVPKEIMTLVRVHHEDKLTKTFDVELSFRMGKRINLLETWNVRPLFPIAKDQGYRGLPDYARCGTLQTLLVVLGETKEDMKNLPYPLSTPFPFAPLPPLSTPTNFFAGSFASWDIVLFLVPLVYMLPFGQKNMFDKQTVLQLFTVMGMHKLTFYISSLLYSLFWIFLLTCLCCIQVFVEMTVAEFFLTFIFLFFFSLCLACIIVVLSHTCHNASEMRLKSFLIIGAAFVLYYFESNSEKKVWASVQSLSFLSALNFFSQGTRRHAAGDDRLTFSNMFSDRYFDSGYALCMIIFDATLYFIVMVLVVFFRPITLWKKPAEKEETMNDLKDAFENTFFSSAQCDIKVSNVHKSFGNQKVVRGLNLECHRGEVTVLLGHNGAGKTTTFNIISGVEKATDGDVIVSGQIVKKAGDIESLGFCPQHNSIYDKLTVKEHLKIVHVLKDAENDIHEEALNLLTELNMADKMDSKAGTLSGGQKRKLSICMALIGGSSVVLLDEPTAGIDTLSRRDVQRLLEKQKANRTFLMTTHYMDEAEQLGDRVAIMVKGKVVCNGSPDFLKKRFASGYLLSIVLQEKVDSTSIVNQLLTLNSAIDVKLKVVETRGRQINFHIDFEYLQKMSAFLADLESKKEQLKIYSFGLSISNLEQVFIKVGELADPTTVVDPKLVLERNKKLANIRNGLGKGGTKWLLQVESIFLKLFFYSIRNFTLIFEQFFIPLLMLGCVAYELWDVKKGGDGVSLDFSEFTDHYTIMFLTESDDTRIEDALRKEVEDYSNIEIMHMSPKAGRTVFPNKQLDQFIQMSEIYNETGGHIPIALIVQLHPQGNIVYFNGYAQNIVMTFYVWLHKHFRPANITVKLTDADSKSDLYAMKTSKNGSQYVILLLIIYVLYTTAASTILMDEHRTMFVQQQMITRTTDVVIYGVFIVTNFLCLMIFMSIFIVYIAVFKLNLAIEHFVLTSICFILSQLALVCLFSRFVRSTTIMLLFLLGIVIGGILLNPISSLLGDGWKDFVNILSMFITPANGFYVINSKKDSTSILLPYISMGFHVFISMLIFTLVQTKEVRKLFARKKNHRAEVKIKIDSCVEREALLDDNGPKNILVVKNLIKYYKKYCAVNSISFHVASGECYGLLGSNGAGKSSTFQMLTGNVFPSGGTATICDESVTGRPKFGYCPQFDPLLNTLTGMETYKIICMQYGVINVTEAAMVILEAVGLETHAHKLVKEYSGGQKRRLSVGLALLAPAPIIFLDEPTAGIDPKTRRIIWDALSYVRQNTESAIVLTSHSMEEVEALCTKMTVMNKGSMAAAGTSQMLKNKFGNSFILSVTVPSAEAKKGVMAKVASIYSKAVLLTKQDAPTMVLKWKIPREANTKWSKMFQDANQLQSDGVKNICISQTTLEEVFMDLVDTRPS